MNTKDRTKSKIIDILQKDDRIWNKEKTELNQTLLFDLLDKIDEKIIDLLLHEKTLREKFFVKIKDVYVFKTNDFKFFMEENKIDNSYSQYKNRIGLTDGKRFLKDTNDVVLDFPYKDCVLEGGQSTEEGTDTYFEYSEKENKYEEKQAKRKEIFYNQILAQDEIDRLFDPKAFVNWKRYTKDGEQPLRHSERSEESLINRDENGTINENLIIKGNNLLALHSLKKQFAGKIKLIYIDPPYNTGGDANIFTYNNRFNHSTWLTFMKNRLETAKSLLKQDGFIAIAIDHEELFYLGVLSDEIFGRFNRIGIVTVLHNPKGRNQAKFFSGNSDFMLIYANNMDSANFRPVAIDEDIKKSFDQQDKIGFYKYVPYMRARTVWSRKNRPKNWYPIYVSKDLENITHKKTKDYYEIYPITNDGKEMAWKNIKDTFIELNKHDYFIARKENGNIRIYHKLREQQVFKNVWTQKKYQSEFQGSVLLKKLLGENKFSYPKSLYTVLDTIKIMSERDDIILDFHAGSGTTGHATLALNKEDGGNRKFILVEQLDEHIQICNERIQKVMEKENIEDSYIYFELAKWNEKAKEEILACKSLGELEKLFDTLYEKYFLNYNLKIKEFKEKVSKEENFRNLSLEEQKKMFMAMLDLNQMYVNKTEMADKKYGINKEDQKLTEEFYKD